MSMPTAAAAGKVTARALAQVGVRHVTRLADVIAYLLQQVASRVAERERGGEGGREGGRMRERETETAPGSGGCRCSGAGLSKADSAKS